MFEEIEMLKSRTEMLLMQMLAQWEQRAITAPDQAQAPYAEVALLLSEVRDKLGEARIAALELAERHGFQVEEFSANMERTVRVEIEEREEPSRSGKSKRK